MGGFRFEQCGNIEGLYLVGPQVFVDERGYNFEAYHAGSFREAAPETVMDETDSGRIEHQKFFQNNE